MLKLNQLRKKRQLNQYNLLGGEIYRICLFLIMILIFVILEFKFLNRKSGIPKSILIVKTLIVMNKTLVRIN